MKTFGLIKKLQEIEANLIAFDGELNQENTDALKSEFNGVLVRLRKNIDYIYEDPQAVINKMILEFKYPEDYAISKRRKREKYVMPRQMTQVLCRHIFKKKSLAYIGEYFTNGSHANLLHAIKTIKNLYETDKIFRWSFDKVQVKILGSVCVDFENLK